MSGHIRKDSIENKLIQEKVGVTLVEEKMTKTSN